MRPLLGLVSFKFGAKDPRKRSNFPRDQEITTHEPLDTRLEGLGAVVAHRPVHVAHPARYFRLEIKGKPLLGPAGRIMQMRSHRPQEIEGPNEGFQFTVGELFQPDKFGRTI